MARFSFFVPILCDGGFDKLANVNLFALFALAASAWVRFIDEVDSFSGGVRIWWVSESCLTKMVFVVFGTTRLKNWWIFK